MFIVQHSTRPIPFYDFALFVVFSLFTDGSPNVERMSSVALGEPPVKRERTTNNVKS